MRCNKCHGETVGDQLQCDGCFMEDHSYPVAPGLCPDPIPDDIQEELTQLRARVKELEEESKRGMAWADRVEKLRLETANNLTKSIENNNEQEVTIELLRLTVNLLQARIRELEEGWR